MNVFDGDICKYLISVVPTLASKGRCLSAAAAAASQLLLNSEQRWQIDCSFFPFLFSILFIGAMWREVSSSIQCQQLFSVFYEF